MRFGTREQKRDEKKLVETEQSNDEMNKNHFLKWNYGFFYFERMDCFLFWIFLHGIKYRCRIQMKDTTPPILCVRYICSQIVNMKRNCAILHNSIFCWFLACFVRLFNFFPESCVQNCILTSMVCNFCYKYLVLIFNCQEYNRFRLSIRV